MGTRGQDNGLSPAERLRRQLEEDLEALRPERPAAASPPSAPDPLERLRAQLSEDLAHADQQRLGAATEEDLTTLTATRPPPDLDFAAHGRGPAPDGQQHSLKGEAARALGRGMGQIVRDAVGGTVRAVAALQELRAAGTRAAGRALPGGVGDAVEALAAGQERGARAARAAGEAIVRAGEAIQRAEMLRPSESVEAGPIFQPGNLRWWTARVFEQAPQLAAQIGLAVGTGGTGTAAQFLRFAGPAALLEGGAAFNEAQKHLSEQGVEGDEARTRALGAAALTGTVAAYLEKIPYSTLLLRRIPGMGEQVLDTFLSRVSAGFGAEATTEALQEAWGDAVAFAARTNPEAFHDWRERYLAAAAIGGVVGGGAAAVTPAGPGQEALAEDELLAQLEAALGSTPSQQVSQPAPADERPGIRARLAGVIFPEGQRQLEAERNERRAAERAAETDPLTGLANKSAWGKARATAEADPETEVVVFDANNFGAVNKKLGHDAGDQLIRELADAIRAAADEHGLGERVFRVGGDEFTVIAPRGVAEQIRTRAEELFGERDVGGVPVSLSGSVGARFQDADAVLQARKAERKGIEPTRALEEEAPAPIETEPVPPIPQAPEGPFAVRPAEDGGFEVVDSSTGEVIDRAQTEQAAQGIARAVNTVGGLPRGTERQLPPARPAQAEGVEVRQGIQWSGEPQAAGATGYNANIDYRGFTAFMAPEDFLSMAPREEFRETTLSYLQGEVEAGRPLGNPFLIVDFSGPEPRVVGHEGRHRARLASMLEAGKPIPVHIIPASEMRARHVTPEHIEALRRGARQQRLEGPGPVVRPNITEVILRGERIALREEPPAPAPPPEQAPEPTAPPEPAPEPPAAAQRPRQPESGPDVLVQPSEARAEPPQTRSKAGGEVARELAAAASLPELYAGLANLQTVQSDSDREKLTAFGQQRLRELQGQPATEEEGAAQAQTFEPGTVALMRPAEIRVDPRRFQFKAATDPETGVSTELRGVRRFDQNLAGVISVWQDPADGAVYVVNGHHRLELAKRAGADRILVRFLDAPTAGAARLLGALQNIAEGRGSPLDAAKVFREQNMTEADLLDIGISLTGATAAKGMALSRLHRSIFDDVATGKFPIERAVVIGAAGLSEAQQLELLEMLKKMERGSKRLTNAQLEELIRLVQGAPEIQVEQETLFGVEQLQQSLAFEKARLSAAVKDRLGKDKRLFAFLAGRGRADRIQEVGAGQVDVDKAMSVAGEAAITEEVYNALSTRSGRLSDALNAAARELAGGEEFHKVASRLYEQAKQIIEGEIDAFYRPRPREGGDGPELGLADPDLFGNETPDELIRQTREQRAREKAEQEAEKRRQTDLFGAPTPGGIAESEAQARRTVQNLRPIVLAGRASRAQIERYQQALALLNRAGAITEEELRVQAQRGRRGTPERVTQAAVRIRGKEYVGDYHAKAAHNAAVELGLAKPDDEVFAVYELMLDEIEAFGFKTSTGRFVDNEEALAISLAAGQGGDARKGYLNAEDLELAALPEPEEDEDDTGDLFDPAGPLLADRRTPEQRVQPPRDPLRANIPFGDDQRLRGNLERPEGDEIDLTNAPRILQALMRIPEVIGREIPLRYKRLGSRSARGVYKPHAEVIRLLEHNNISTAAHELGHGIEKLIYGWPKGGPWKQNVSGVTKDMQGELKRLGVELYGTKKPAGGYKREGFAEYVRLSLTDPDEASRAAPLFHEWFEAVFLEQRSDLREAWETARAEVTKWRAMGSVERAKQSIIYPGRPKERARRGLASLREGLTMEKLVEMAQPLYRMARAAEERLGRALRPQEDPFFTLSSLRLTHHRRVRYMVEEGMIDLAGNVVGPSLMQIRALVGGKQEDFTIYLWARRAVRLWTKPDRLGRTRNPGISLEDAAQIIKELETPEFMAAAAHVYEWTDGVLEYAAQGSETLRQMVERIREGDVGDYIPLQREFEELNEGWARSKGRGSAFSGSMASRLRGSGRRVKDPIASLLANAARQVRLAHERIVLEQILTLAQTVEGMGQFVEEIPRDRIPKYATSIMSLVERVGRELEERGLEWQVVEAESGLPVTLDRDAGEATAEDGKLVAPPEAFNLEEIVTFFGYARTPSDADKPIIPVVAGNTVRWYEVDKELYHTLTSIEVYRLPEFRGLAVAETVLGKPTALFRAGTTGFRASFGLLWNPMRDLQAFLVNTRSSAHPAYLLKAYLSTIRELWTYRLGGEASEWVDLFMRLGGEMAQPLGQDIGHTDRAARRLFQDQTTRVLDPRNWFDFYRDLVQTPEAAPRIAEMRLVAEELGWQPGEPLDIDTSMQLLLAGRQVTTDFGAAGEFARVWNRIAPFHNSAIQGPRAALRAMRRNPQQFFTRGAALVAMSLLLWYEYRDEEWYKEMDLRERFLNWHFPWTNPFNGEDELIRLPRAFEIGAVFSALPEFLMDSWYRKDPEAALEWFKIFLQSSTPNMTPVLAAVVAEQLANEEFYFDRPIVPRGEQRKPAEEQFNEYTTRTAVILGRLFNVSPRRIDHAVRGVFGPFATDLLRGLGLGAPGVELEDELSDLPILGRAFQRGGQLGQRPRSIEQLYDALEQAQRRQASDVHHETDEERHRRLLLNDAAQAVTALLFVRRYTPARADREELTREATNLAREALEAVGKDEADRGPFTSARREAQARRDRVRRAARGESEPTGRPQRPRGLDRFQAQERGTAPPVAAEPRQSLVDSLVAVVGPTTLAMGEEPEDVMGAWAYVDPAEPRVIRLTRQLLEKNGDWLDRVLVHEFGHVADRTERLPDQLRDEVERTWRTRLGREGERDPFLSRTYGGMSAAPQERIAESFKAAFYLLRESHERPEVGPKLAEVMDAAVPAASAVAEWMVRQPAFSTHPLRDQPEAFAGQRGSAAERRIAEIDDGLARFEEFLGEGVRNDTSVYGREYRRLLEERRQLERQLAGRAGRS